MNQAIIVDIDGVLADCSHRLSLIQQTPKNWPEFHSKCGGDSVNEWAKMFIKKFWDRHDMKVVLLSARVAESKEDTKVWLYMNGIPFDELILRTHGDHRDDHIFKADVYDNYLKNKYDVLLTVEDRKRVVDMWRSKGLVCLQCVEGNF